MRRLVRMSDLRSDLPSVHPSVHPSVCNNSALLGASYTVYTTLFLCASRYDEIEDIFCMRALA